MDMRYRSVGMPFEQALHVLATATGRPAPDHAITDAGLKAATPEFGMPQVADIADAEYVSLSEEHGSSRGTAALRSTYTTASTLCAATGSRPSGRQPPADGLTRVRGLPVFPGVHRGRRFPPGERPGGLGLRQEHTPACRCPCGVNRLIRPLAAGKNACEA